jgi:hypothetical protein
MVVDESLCLFHNDVDKKVYEIEYEVTYITKWQVIAEDENEAMNKWLQEHKLDLATEDGKDCVCSYVKDYTEIGKVQEIAKIKYNEEDDEVYADES